MPGARTHWMVGKAVGIASPLAVTYAVAEGHLPSAVFAGNPMEEIAFIGYIAGALGCSLVGATLPDIFEPASVQGPSHRQFFHSWIFMGVLIALTIAILWGVILTEPTSTAFFLRNILVYVSLGAISHLLLDWLN